jgi:hypothetical protein
MAGLTHAPATCNPGFALLPGRFVDETMMNDVDYRGADMQLDMQLEI